MRRKSRCRVKLFSVVAVTACHNRARLDGTRADLDGCFIQVGNAHKPVWVRPDPFEIDSRHRLHVMSQLGQG